MLVKVSYTAQDDTLVFRVLTTFAVVVGGSCSLFYMKVIDEKTVTKQAFEFERAKECLLLGSSTDKEFAPSHHHPIDWLSNIKFYLTAVAYTCSRVAINCNATMMPFYLVVVLGFKSSETQAISPSIALVPLITNVASFAFTLQVESHHKLKRFFNHRVKSMFVALAFTLWGSLPLLMLDRHYRYAVLPCSALLGVGAAIMLNTASCLVSDLIGKDVKSAAFVYGSYSLCDNWTNGILLYFLIELYSMDAGALANIVTCVPIICALGATAFSMILISLRTAKSQKQTSEYQTELTVF